MFRSIAPSLCGLALVAASPPAAAFPFGAGTCEANADGSFMTNGRTHHPGQSGGFVLRFEHPSFYAGETLRLELTHDGGELFKGFLLYARSASGRRDGLFQPMLGATFSGALPAECEHIGHTITHNNQTAPEPMRSRQPLVWTAPTATLPPEALTFYGLVLRADPISEAATDFYELRVALPYDADGVFRSSLEGDS